MLELGQQETEKGLEQWDKRPKNRAQEIMLFKSEEPIRSVAGRLWSDGLCHFSCPIGWSPTDRLVDSAFFGLWLFLRGSLCTIQTWLTLNLELWSDKNLGSPSWNAWQIGLWTRESSCNHINSIFFTFSPFFLHLAIYVTQTYFDTN